MLIIIIITATERRYYLVVTYLIPAASLYKHSDRTHTGCGKGDCTIFGKVFTAQIAKRPRADFRKPCVLTTFERFEFELTNNGYAVRSII